MRNVSDKICRVNQNTFCVQHFFFNHAVYEITLKNIAERGRQQMAIWRKHIACWIPKATNTHSQYVILIAIPLQQWLHERASVSRYTYIALLYFNIKKSWRWQVCSKQLLLFAFTNVYWTVRHCNSWRMKDQLDVTCYFISLIMCSTCSGH